MNIPKYNGKMPAGFNWIAVLKDLKAGADLSFDSKLSLQEMAGDWPTCACGQLCDALPRDTDGMPYDNLLSTLGCDFYGAICCDDWDSALRLFHQIEARTTELLIKQE